MTTILPAIILFNILATVYFVIIWGRYNKATTLFQRATAAFLTGNTSLGDEFKAEAERIAQQTKRLDITERFRK